MAAPRKSRVVPPVVQPDVVLREVRPGRVRKEVRVNLWPEDAEDLIEKARRDPVLGALMVQAGEAGHHWGRQADVTPAEAILSLVRRTEAFIEWLEDRLRAFGSVDLALLPAPWPKPPKGREDENVERLKGVQVRALMKLYTAALDRQSRVAKSAEAMRLAERIVALNEGRVSLMSEALYGVLGGLGLSAEQKELVPGLMRSHITALMAKSAPARSPFAIEVRS